jgi:hypothetical protein
MSLFIGTMSSQKAYCGNMLPDNAEIEEVFQPGIGKPVGKVQTIQGEAFILHEDASVYYRAQKDIPLFEGDTIVTPEKGRIRFELNDGSVVTLSSRTRLVISRSVYNPDEKNRSSFLGMAVGKARFWVTKLAEFRLSEFKVKTRTAVVGVRGSDFIIRADAERTEVTALEKTDLEIVSLIGPDTVPTLITDFEHAVVEQNALPLILEELEDIEAIKREFDMAPEPAEPEREMPKREDIRVPMTREQGILVPYDAIVRPEEVRGIDEPLKGPPPEDIRKTEKEKISMGEKDFFDKVERMSEETDRRHPENAGRDIMQDVFKKPPPGTPPPDNNEPLPSFPGEPE